MSTIEGGMISTNDAKLYETLRLLRSHGMVRESSNELLIKQYREENSLLNKEFDTSKIIRVFVNCFGKGDVTQWHTDPGGKSYMIYLNSEWKRHWGAPTSFKNKRKIYPKPGRLVVFSADIEHKGNAPTIFMPKYFPGRFSMVFQERS